MLMPAAGIVADDMVGAARVAQRHWAAIPVRRRLGVLRSFRHLLADQAERFAALGAAVRECSIAEVLASEVLPLLEACRFLERNAVRLLRPRRLGLAGRPLGFGSSRGEVRRDPRGVVLIIGPGNYPLFLAGAQVLQALAAGNAALLKPGEGCAGVGGALIELLVAAGLDSRLCAMVDLEQVEPIMDGGVDHLVLTGSAETGRIILEQCAARLIPATLELSGCDSVLVRADADLELVVRSLDFGLRLNRGRTCLAPRVAYVLRSVATELEGRLAERLMMRPAFPTGRDESAWVLVSEALAAGGHLLSGHRDAAGRVWGPVVVAGAPASCRVCRVESPVLALVTVGSDEEALEAARCCPYGLGATVFSRDQSAACELAEIWPSGVVVINDMIAPTADPRVPFGGRRRSGFGVTRGPEGLLEMTVPKAVLAGRGQFRPHLHGMRVGDGDLFGELARGLHGRGMRWASWLKIIAGFAGRPRRPLERAWRTKKP